MRALLRPSSSSFLAAPCRYLAMLRHAVNSTTQTAWTNEHLGCGCYFDNFDIVAASPRPRGFPTELSRTGRFLDFPKPVARGSTHGQNRSPSSQGNDTFSRYQTAQTKLSTRAWKSSALNSPAAAHGKVDNTVVVARHTWSLFILTTDRLLLYGVTARTVVILRWYIASPANPFQMPN